MELNNKITLKLNRIARASEITEGTDTDRTSHTVVAAEVENVFIIFNKREAGDWLYGFRESVNILGRLTVHAQGGE